ncbi:hypothetical protein BM1_05118 [Bipolaris maydis]|nr:hypothetical protein BM1_05118 [Bipolaris maydis]
MVEWLEQMQVVRRRLGKRADVTPHPNKPLMQQQHVPCHTIATRQPVIDENEMRTPRLQYIQVPSRCTAPIMVAADAAVGFVVVTGDRSFAAGTTAAHDTLQ